MRTVRFFRYWLPPLIWMGIIFGGSTDIMSGKHTSRFIEPMLRWIDPSISDETIHVIQFQIRKCAHITEYAILSLLLWRARRKPVKNDLRSWTWSEPVFAIWISGLYAASDEFHQSFVSTRQGSPWDVLIDTCGATLAMLVLWRFFEWSRRRKKNE